VSISSKVAKGTVFLTLSNFAVQALGFVSFYALTKNWEEAIFGRYAFIFTFFSLGGMVCTLGLDGIVKAEILLLRPTGELGKLKRILQEHTRLKLFIGLAAVAVLSCAGFFFTSWVQYAPVIFVAAGVYFFVVSFRWLYDSIFHALTEFRLLLCFNALDAMVRLGLILFIVVALRDTISQNMQLALVLCSFPVSVAVAELIFLPSAMKKLDFLHGIAPEGSGLLKSIILKRGKYAIFIPQVRTLMEQIPVWFIRALLGEASVAVFGIARKGYITLLSFFKAIEGAILPVAIEQISKSWGTARLLLKKSIKYTLVAAVAIIIASYLLAPFVFKALWQDKYLDSIPVFRILLLIFIIQAFELIAVPALYAFRRQDHVLFAHVIAAVAACAIIYATAATLGLLGVSAALIGVKAVLVGTYYYFIRKSKPDFKLTPTDFFSFDQYDRRVLGKLTSRFGTKSDPESDPAGGDIINE